MHQLWGFHHGNGDEDSHPKQTLYSLKQSPWYFFEYISKHLIKNDLSLSKFDPCLMSSSLIVIIYIEDRLINWQSEDSIITLIEQPKKENVALHCEGTSEGYLGVDIIQWEGSQLTLLQQGLKQSIIEALGLDSKYSTPTDTPAETAALRKDVDGKEASSSINHASIIGMLLYLGHSHPYISFATHQCVQYTHSPKQSHEDALKQIGHYLNGTLDKGLILTPEVAHSRLIAIQMQILQDCGHMMTNKPYIVCRDKLAK